ncbi:hypothetical protein QJQ45_009316 [Haematococcus lacustris]|nr:hypothetical protein QJQ45_009316 [Haematococcus lacustris]
MFFLSRAADLRHLEHASRVSIWKLCFAGAQGILWPVLHCPETADFLDSHPCPRGHRYFANQQGQVVLASAARVRSPANQTLLRWAKLADLPADRQPITDLMPDLQVQQVMSGINPFSMSPPSINPWSYPEAWADLAPVPSPSGSASPSRCSACSPATHSLLSSLSPTSPPTICVIPEPQTRSLPPELLALSRQHPDEVAAAAALAAAAASLAAAEAVAQRGAAFITAFNELPPDHAAAVSATAAGARACVMAAAAAPGPPAAKYSSLISSLLALFKRTGPVAGQEDSGCLGPAAPDGDGGLGSGLADDRAFLFDPATQMGMGLDSGAIQAVSAASGVWRADGRLQGFYRCKLTRSQVQHDSGLIQARHNTQRWNENVKLELQHLAAATPAGTSLVAIQRHVAVRLATRDAVWGEYLHPKWAEQKMRLHGAQEKVLERYFKKLEEAASVSQQEWGTRKQLVVFFGNAGIGTRGGWVAKAVLQACRKVVEKPNSGKPTDRVSGRVVTADEFCTSRVSSILNSPQPCEEELDSSKPTRPEDWKPKPGQVQNRLLRSAWSKRFEAPVRGLMWCPWLAQATPGDLGKWVDRDCNAALNLQRAGETKWRPLELCRWPHRGRLPAQGKEYPALGFKKLRDRAPKATAQQPVAQ